MKLLSHQQCSGTDADRLWKGRSAFTLLELLLVLTIITTIAAVTFPGLLQRLTQQSVRGTAEQVRQLLDNARVRAVEEGRILQLRYEPNGRRYVLLPYEPMSEETTTMTESSSARPFAKTESTRPTEPFRVFEMPEDCRFHVDNTFLSGERIAATRLGEEWMGYLSNPSGIQDVSWSNPVLFNPDGSATGASLVVMNKQRQYVKLHVRGLTGAVWAEPLKVMEERLGTTGN
ncbi:prepilin-type N-terminal cleavage/methylation domain-containing protein [Planctomicrobium sp. SH668]|uniref:prepilin-type N-terminal cleavage/methylation domain-containing protein n=1 Tax=Planctomicrobium sp. SH668 TaxID=3448126 RepID=UPI003F5C4FF8